MPGLAREFRALGRWPALLPMVISTLASVGMFSLFTYITPLLEGITGMPKKAPCTNAVRMRGHQ